MSTSKKLDALAELKRQLVRLAPKQQLDALISQTNAQAAVRSVPAEQLYTAITDVGLADSTEIVQLASPAQFQTFLDLAGWKRDRIDPHSLLTWLRAARGDEPEDFLAKLEKMDLELLEYLLRAFTNIHDLEEDPDVNPEGVTLESPEGKYLIEFTVDGPELAAMRALVNDLITKDPFQAGRLLEAIRWELGSELEETAYRFRAARLEDLGFPQLDQAMAVFTYVDPSSLKKVAEPKAGLVAPASERVDYFERAFAGLNANEQDAVADELRYLVNATLVAEAADPGELEAVRRVAEMARDYLSLGVELLCGGDVFQAAEVVREHELRRVFQAGFSLTLQLKFKVDRLAKEPLARVGDAWMALTDEAAMLTSLRRKRPLRALKVEGAEPVPFRSRRELVDAAACVERAAVQVAFFREVLGGTAEKLAAFGEEMGMLTADRLFAAVASQAVLEGKVVVPPVASGRLAELGGKLFEGEPTQPKVKAVAVDRAVEVLKAHLPDETVLRSMLDRTFGRMATELGAAYLSDRRLDPALTALILPVSIRS